MIRNPRSLILSLKVGLSLGALSLCIRPAAFAGTDIVNFSSGALIIPEQASFQTPCGAASAYGLVWRILQSNQPGHYNETHPVTVYWVINGSKVSINRCVPSNVSTPPWPNVAGPSGDASHWDDPQWNDGCDVSIQNNFEQPVVPVPANYASISFPLTGQYPHGDIPMLDTSAATFEHQNSGQWFTMAVPSFPSMVLNNSGVDPNRFNTVQYLGGPFVIDAPDAANVINFLQLGDSFVSASELSKFTTDTGCGTVPDVDHHYVQMHQATIGFSGVVGRRMSSTPPRIALLDTGVSVKFSSLYLAGVRVLDQYLKLAGLYVSGTLDHTDSAGCPPGTLSGCTLNGSDATTQYSGFIYDQFNAYHDLASTATNTSGLLNAADGTGKPLYPIFWAPHFNTSDLTDYGTGAPGNPDVPEYVDPGDGSSGNVVINSLINISTFLNRRGSGMMAECASIGTFEGGRSLGGDDIPSQSNATHFQFNNTVASPYSLNINAMTHNSSVIFDGRPCDDPDYPGTGQCIVYPNAASTFGQMGDWHFVASQGSVNGMTPMNPPSSFRKPGVVPLAVTWQDYNPGDYPSNPTNESDGNDVFNFTFKDNDPYKGAIVYVGGHEQIGSTSGTRIVLNTLLNLGFAPFGQDRAIAAPVAFSDRNGDDASGTRSFFLSPNFKAMITGWAFSNEVFTADSPSNWRFPLTTGDLRWHPAVGPSALLQGESLFTDSVLLGANAQLPLPALRNLFTFLGGSVVPNLILPGGLSSPNGAGESGWVPVQVSSQQINADPSVVPNPNCVDNLHPGDMGDGTFGLTAGADGVCDLHEALEFTFLNAGTDLGVGELGDNVNAMITDADNAAAIATLVRGFCYATTGQKDGSGSFIAEPGDTQCNNPEATNRAALGGLVHSSPAIVPPSTRVPDQGAPRPTVAYVGGWDGQLHAFYISGGAGYTGPAVVVTAPNHAASVFRNDWRPNFAAGTLPNRLTELWSFIPGGQLPLLRGNIAQVDSCPVVQDVFADFAGTGILEWRTLLVSSVGINGRGLFIVDVTNPLAPVYLGGTEGSLPQSGKYPWYPTVSLQDTSVGASVFQWNARNALYNFPPLGDPGRSLEAVYDWTNIGGLLGIAMKQMRAGLAPYYAAFITTNLSPASSIASKGIVAAAIHIPTGQKLWEWVKPYSSELADNSVPQPALVFTGDGGNGTVFVADMEGRLWELDTATGVNVNTYGGVQYPAFDAHSLPDSLQPITSVALARIPPNASGSVFGPHSRQYVLIVGTAGTDWTQSTDPGNVHMVLIGSQNKVPFQNGGLGPDGTAWTASYAQSYAAANGVYPELSPFPYRLQPGEKVYSAAVSGQTAYVTTATSSIGDPKKLKGSGGGRILKFDLAVATDANPTVLPGNFATYGQVAVLHLDTGPNTSTDVALFSEVSKQDVIVTNNSGSSGPGSPNSTLNPANSGIAAKLIAWFSRFLRI